MTAGGYEGDGVPDNIHGFLMGDESNTSGQRVYPEGGVSKSISVPYFYARLILKQARGSRGVDLNR